MDDARRYGPRVFLLLLAQTRVRGSSVVLAHIVRLSPRTTRRRSCRFEFAASPLAPGSTPLMVAIVNVKDKTGVKVRGV